MKPILIAILAMSSAFGAVEVKTAKLRGGLLPGIVPPKCFVGPVENRDLFNVFVRSDDAMVRAFRIAVTYEYDGQRVAVQRIVADTGESDLPQGLAMFPIPDVAAKILSVTVAELKDSSSVEVPQ